MLKKGLLAATAALMIGCGGSTPTNNNGVANSSNAPASNTAQNAAKNTAPANTNAPAVNKANAAAKPAESGPQRISFAAGKSEGKVDVKLGPGEAKQFVVGAKTGQILMIDADSFETKITMVKGKVAKEATLEEPGHYDTTLLDNGDFVFEVKNTTKVEMKTVVTVVISGGK